MNYFVYLLLCCLFNHGFLSAQPELHKALSYNIRYDGHSDLAPDWGQRKVPIVTQLQAEHPTIIGFQEVLKNQLDDLSVALPSFRVIGVGRDDGKSAGEFAPIFFDTTRYQMLQSGTFWLSLTPDIPSKGWDAALNRICTYALLQSKYDGKKLWVLNTHFDHIGEAARLHSAQLLIEKFAEFTQVVNAPLLLLGDFNAEPESPVYQLLQAAFQDLSCLKRHRELCSGPTFNAFTLSEADDKIIDYFFGSPGLISIRYNVLQTPFDRSYPSDHFALVLTFISL
ncbi:MAG: endonuclease/exonuclease/phosphatase family protein [Crocinitomicaceae bacterium]|nr:endonuclease/exonuclease/phosphatase family protein [Crocinitomicaceae bacterium]MDP4805837.1 endonuclease/exonuclease/phosphatase family protein [Crocinitomicaceae bacterium]